MKEPQEIQHSFHGCKINYVFHSFWKIMVHYRINNNITLRNSLCCNYIFCTIFFGNKKVTEQNMFKNSVRFIYLFNETECSFIETNSTLKIIWTHLDFRHLGGWHMNNYLEEKKKLAPSESGLRRSIFCIPRKLEAGLSITSCSVSARHVRR